MPCSGINGVTMPVDVLLLVLGSVVNRKSGASLRWHRHIPIPIVQFIVYFSFDAFERKTIKLYET